MAHYHSARKEPIDNDRYALFNDNLIDKIRLDDWIKALQSGQILYFYGIIGLGKTTYAHLVAQGIEGAVIHTFSNKNENMKTAVEQRLVECIMSDQMHVFILDELKFYDEKQIHRWLDSTILQYGLTSENIRFILIGITDLAPNLAIKALQHQIIPIDARDFYLNESLIRLLFSKLHTSRGLTDSHALECFEITSGYPLAVHSYIINSSKKHTFKQLRKQIYSDIDDVLSTEINDFLDDINLQTLTLLSVYSCFTRHMANELLLDYPELSLELALLRYPIFQESDSCTYYLPFVRQALLKHLNIFMEEGEQTAFFRRAGDISRKHGRLRQSFDCYQLANDHETIFESALSLFELNDLYTIRNLPFLAFDENKSKLASSPRLLSAQASLALLHLKDMKASQLRALLKKKSDEEMARNLNDRPYTMYYLRTLLASPGVCLEALEESFRIFVDLYADNDIKDWVATERTGLKHLNPLYAISFYQNESFRFYSKLMRNLERDLRLSVNFLLARLSHDIGRRSAFHSYLSNIRNDLNGTDFYNYKVSADIEMARMYFASGKPEKARNVIESIREEATWRERNEIKQRVATFENFLNLQEDQIDEAINWLEYDRRSREKPILAIDYMRIYGEALIQIRLNKYDEAYESLMPIDPFVEMSAHGYVFIVNRILKSILLHRTGGEWLALLMPAVEIAAKYGLIQVFADHGNALLPLWQELRPNEKVNAEYLRIVLLRLTQMASFYPFYLYNPVEAAGPESLTDREQQVLVLIREGHTNKIIAELLFISIATVKFHIANIMKKLDATNRTDAVRRARNYGILKEGD